MGLEADRFLFYLPLENAAELDKGKIPEALRWRKFLEERAGAVAQVSPAGEPLVHYR